jgi:hypothetical protein
LRRAVSALPVRMWSSRLHQLTQVGDDLKQGARKSQSWARGVWVQLSHLHDLCGLLKIRQPFRLWQVVARHEGESPHAVVG